MAKAELTSLLVCASLLVVAAAAVKFKGFPAKASYYTGGTATPSGVCGYGKTKTYYNSDHSAAVSVPLWLDGSACGSCFHVKCSDAGVCNDEGVNVVVTDQADNIGQGSEKEPKFVLNSPAFERLAVKNMTSEITKIRVIDVDYRRIECRYGLRNLTVKVAEQSKFPDYLAVVVMYQAGAFDLRGVNVFDWASGDWRTMARGDGAVFEIRDAPTAEAKRMIYLGLEFNPVMRLESFFHVADIPATWKVGHAYGSSYQLPVHEPP